MIEIVKELKIEVSKTNIFQAVVAKQYDMNTRFIKATLVDGSDVITIPLGPTIKAIINAERPDGQSKGFDGAVNEDGTVTVPLHSWMLEMEGTVICDISIIDTATDDNKKLTTTAFTLLVEKAAYGGNDVTNDPQYDVLIELMENCQKANELALEALEKSSEANEKMDACIEATENANEATETANHAANQAFVVRRELEEGGFVESLKEQNKGAKLTFWVGTTAEYEAISNKEKNCLYISTDDPMTDEIQAAIEEIKSKINDIPVCGALLFEGYGDEAISSSNDFARTIEGISKYKLFFVECGLTNLTNAISGSGVFSVNNGCITGLFIGTYLVKNENAEPIAQGVGNGKLQLWFNTVDNDIAPKDTITTLSCSFNGGGYEWATLEVYKIIGIC